MSKWFFHSKQRRKYSKIGTLEYEFYVYKEYEIPA